MTEDSNSFDREEAEHALDDLLKLLDRIPGAAKFKSDVSRLKALLIDRRAPRIVIVGRRGHGKSSIANALLGAPKLPVGHAGDQPASDSWLSLDVDGRKLDWLDTSGLGAGGKAPERLAVLKRQVSEALPDVVLYACKAKDVDAEVDATLDGVKAILTELRDAGSTAPLVVVVTQADELHPAREMSPPYSESKKKLIAGAIEILSRHLDRHGIERRAVLPVSAYVEFTENHELAFDGRWNIGRLAEVIFETLPDAAAVEAARAFHNARSLRRRVAKRIASAASAIAFGIGLTPIPIADLLLLAPLQGTMVSAIVYLSGRRLAPSVVAEWIASLGAAGAAGYVLRLAFQQLVKLIPVGGSFVSGGIAAAGTYAIGLSAIAYFIDDKTLDEARQVFKETRKTARDGWQPPAEEDAAG